MEDIISMSPFSINLLIIGLAILAIGLTVYYRIDGFDSSPTAGTRACDSSPSCTGAYSKDWKSADGTLGALPCCKTPVAPVYPKSQSDCSSSETFIKGETESGNYCAICTQLKNGKTECRSSASYNSGDFKSGSIDNKYSSSDVRSDPATPTYLTDLKSIYDDEETKDKGRDDKGRSLYNSSFSFLGDDDGIITSKGSDLGKSNSDTTTSGSSGKNGSKGGSWSNSNYWTNGRSGSMGSDWLKNSDDSIEEDDSSNSSEDNDSSSSSNYNTCSFDDDSLNNLLDNRLKSCKKLQERTLERPSELSYNEGAKKGADTCNKYKSCDDNEEEEEVCEGFSPLL